MPFARFTTDSTWQMLRANNKDKSQPTKHKASRLHCPDICHNFMKLTIHSAIWRNLCYLTFTVVWGMTVGKPAITLLVMSIQVLLLPPSRLATSTLYHIYWHVYRATQLLLTSRLTLPSTDHSICGKALPGVRMSLSHKHTHRADAVCWYTQHSC